MTSEPNDSTPVRKSNSRDRSRSGSWKLRFLTITLVALAVILFFLPTILVNTPLKNWAIETATADLNGSLEVDKVSVGWFSPVRLSSLTLRDEHGEEVLTADSIETSATLLGLATSTNYGTVRIVRPSVDLRMRQSGSNLEDVLATYLATDETESSTELPRLRIEVIEGEALLRSDSISQVHLIEQIQCDVEVMGELAPLVVQLSCAATDSISGNEQQPGTLRAAATIDQGQPTMAMSQIEAQIDSQKFPLAVLAPVLTRLVSPSNCAGRLDGSLQILMNSDMGTADIRVERLNARGLAVVCPELLGDDQLSTANLVAQGELRVSATELTAKQFKLETEFAQIDADGSFDAAQIAALTSSGDLPLTDFQLDASVDLARLTAMLPQTTRLREGVELHSGSVNLQASTKRQNGHPRVVFNGEASNMNFVVGGQNIQWHQPLRLTAVAAQHGGGLAIEDLKLDSEFASMAGTASIDQGNFSIEADLNRAMQQVGQIVDLGGLHAAGQLAGQFNWRVAKQSTSAAVDRLQIKFAGQFRLTQPELQLPGYQRWQQPRLDLAIDGDAAASSEAVAVDAANLQLQIGQEKATGALVEPISNVMAMKKCKLQCQLEGSIARWLDHARNFVEFPEFFADGNLSSSFVLATGGQFCRLNQLQLEATDFVLDGFAMQIREPTVQANMNLKYRFLDGELQFANATLATASVAASSPKLVLGTANRMTLVGDVSFRANVNRASQWFGFSLDGDEFRFDGSAVGLMKFDDQPKAFGGTLQTQITDLVFVQPVSNPTAANRGMQVASNRTSWSEVWREPDVQLQSEIRLSDDFNNLTLRAIDLKSKMADVQGKGTINDLAGTMLANLNGRWNVKWAEVSRLINSYAGNAVSIEGEGWRPVEVNGPLYSANVSTSSEAWIPPQLSATAALAWQQATVFDVPLGRTQIDARLQNSMARLSSENSRSLIDQLMQLQPVLDMRQAEPLLTMNEGTLLDRWRVTETDSRTWLKYAAPLVADATSAQGQLSARLQNANVPLFNPAMATARGEIEIHELTVGAGPLAQQLIPIVDQVRKLLKRGGEESLADRTTWLQLKPQTLPFAVEAGRVHHDGFEMSYKEFVIRTSGSVGFDQTMNLVAEIPIAEQWVAGDRMLSRLAGKSISIPITGTLAQPKIDPRVVTQMAQQLVRDSAVAAVNEKVSGEVQRVQEKIGNEVQEELGRFQKKVDDKFKSEVQDRLQNELRDGLQGLFGGDRKKQE